MASAEEVSMETNEKESNDLDPQIKNVYYDEIFSGSFNLKNIMKLELSQYLESTLWPNYSPTSCSNRELIMSIVVMVNEKFREHVTLWDTFELKPEHFSLFFSNVTMLILNENICLNLKEKTALLLFLIHSFNSIEIELVRTEIQRYISMPIWQCLSFGRLELEFKKVPKLKKFWKKLEKNDKNLSPDDLAKVQRERRFLYNLILDFFKCLNQIPSRQEKVGFLNNNEKELVKYCERFLEFMVDLEALLPTRRFFNALVDDLHVITIGRMSKLCTRPKEGKLFGQLLDNLKYYVRFEIDDVTGEALTDSKIAQIHFSKVTRLQQIIYKLFGDEPEFRSLYLANVSSIDNRDKILKNFSNVEESKLIELCSHLCLGFDSDEQVGEMCLHFANNLSRKEILLEILVDQYERVDSQLKLLNSLPLYPSEQVIWDENLVPTEYQDGCLALPKLNIQFLTLHDYLLRNFHLFRLESTYEIRQDIENAVAHLKPWQTEDGGVMFGGWARMAIPIDSFAVTQIGKANIGEDKPSRVKAEIVVNLNVKKSIKSEWESLRRHDVCFLVTVRPEVPPGTPYNHKKPFIPQVGLTYVRGCEVEGMLDTQGRVIDENLNEKPTFHTDFRTYRVWLDVNQYKYDTSTGNLEIQQVEEEIYDSFNILLRRKPKENNFKAVLETIRDLMNTKCVVPDWLHDVILGYGDPSSAHYSQLETNTRNFEVLDFFDSFIDIDHVRESFKDYNLTIEKSSDTEIQNSTPPPPPYRLKIDEENKTVAVSPYVIPNRGPYLIDQPKHNQIRFTPTQIEAIRAGIQHGLTMVVGPPGTGKTDLAVQIISNLYHNHPDQRTIIVTHSNQALNAIFEKIMSLDIDERHLLRLGRGEEELETDKDFSRYGRVNYVLSKRIELLDIVAKLAQSLGLSDDVAYTCETAGYFYLYHVLSKWESFLYQINDPGNNLNDNSPKIIQEKFPFNDFFADVQPLFHGQSFAEDFEIAKGCFRFIKKMFTQLDEFRAFEMMRSGSDRANYLLVREAKIIAMTCTHAALKRKELANLMFQYDNILMEEAGQILEIETFIPLLLQNPEFGHNRLKRWIMIGDHLQLPPVIKNVSFQKFSNMEQSLFARFVRLGVPTIYLDAQGRARPTISALYNWRYKNLGNLKHVLEQPEYQKPNPGFVHDFQLINVEDFNGIGESEPFPYFFQNLAEAEYLVAVFMYMRLVGYPAEKITILTTYNGQKHLIRDVVEQRCASNPFIGRPSKIATVDKFQGQQNDYILLSLVRTKTVGHIRDIRRLTVAMSRARLGMYIFARSNLFSSCYELQRTFKLLRSNRPVSLELLPNEQYHAESLCERNIPVDKSAIRSIGDMPSMVQFVFEFYQKRVEQLKQEQPQTFESIVNRIRTAGKPEDKSTESKENAEDDDDDEDEDEETSKDAAGLDEEEDEVMFEKLNEHDTGLNDDHEMLDAAEAAAEAAAAAAASAAEEEAAKKMKNVVPADVEV